MSYFTLDAVIERLQELRGTYGNITCLAADGFQLRIDAETDNRFLNDVASEWNLEENDLSNGIVLIGPAD